MFDPYLNCDLSTRYGFDTSRRRIPSIEIATPPDPLVNTAAMMRHLRIDLLIGDDADTVAKNNETSQDVADYVMAAQMHIDGPDGSLDRCIGRQQLIAHVSEYDSGDIRLPYGPIISVDAVTYKSAAGDTVIVDPTLYFLERGNRVRKAFNLGWASSGVSVKYTAGYATPPAPLVQAVKLLAAHFYEHRLAVAELGMQALPIGVDRLIQPYRTYM